MKITFDALTWKHNQKAQTFNIQVSPVSLASLLTPSSATSYIRGTLAIGVVNMSGFLQQALWVSPSVDTDSWYATGATLGNVVVVYPSDLGIDLPDNLPEDTKVAVFVFTDVVSASQINLYTQEQVITYIVAQDATPPQRAGYTNQLSSTVMLDRGVVGNINGFRFYNVNNPDSPILPYYSTNIDTYDNRQIWEVTLTDESNSSGLEYGLYELKYLGVLIYYFNFQEV